MDACKLLSSMFAVAVLLVGTSSAHAERVTHTVEYGDMLGSIAEEYGVSVSQIRQWNDLSSDMIRIGQDLVIHTDQANRGSTRGGEQVHVVASGETLGGIASRYDCSIDDLVSWNRGLDPDRIREGQELRVRTQGRVQRRVEYVVQPGDFLGAIASRHGVSVSDITGWNRGLDPDRIRNGQSLVLWLEGPEEPSESVGSANGGQLVNGEQLPPHRAYVIRNADVAWGTNETISAILDSFDAMVAHFDRLPRVRVHDLSRESGGYLAGHRSHQSGRDADIGYYHDGCTDDCAYIAIDGDDLDVERQWWLLRYWINHDLIEYVFIDYDLQRALYEYVDEVRGATDEQLREWFQYPRGRDTAVGLIRHEPNHADHLHVRFACAGGDNRCR